MGYDGISFGENEGPDVKPGEDDNGFA